MGNTRLAVEIDEEEKKELQIICIHNNWSLKEAIKKAIDLLKEKHKT